MLYVLAGTLREARDWFTEQNVNPNSSNVKVILELRHIEGLRLYPEDKVVVLNPTLRVLDAYLRLCVLYGREVKVDVSEQ